MNVRKLLAISLGVIGSFFVGTIAASNTYAAPANPVFKDDNFYKCVIAGYNSATSNNVNVTTNLTDAQLAQVKTLSCNSTSDANYASISDLSGIEKLTSLARITLVGTAATSLDLSNTSSLVTFVVTGNSKLTTVKMGTQPNLEYAEGYNNAISSIDVSGATALTYLNLYNNKLSSIDVSKNTALNNLVLSKNNLSSLDTSQISNNLHWLFIYDNNLTELDFTSRDFYNAGSYNTLYTEIFADDILIKTGVRAYYNDEYSNYVVAMGWLAEALGLQYLPTNTEYVYATVPTTNTYYYTNSSNYKSYVVITDPENYPGYVQVVSNGKQSWLTSLHDPSIGQDTTKRTLKLKFEKYQPTDGDNDSNAGGRSGTNSTSGTSSNSSNNGGLKAPDTGFFIGNIEGGVLIGISVAVMAGIAVTIGIVRYVAYRRAHRVRFHK